MNGAIVTQPNTTGILMNLLGKELRILSTTSQEYSSFEPATGFPVPRVEWEEWDKGAGLHSVVCSHERSISILPGTNETGVFNGIFSLVCPAESQCRDLRFFWQQNIQFRHAQAFDLPRSAHVVSKNSQPACLMDSVGPAAKEHFLPSPPLPASNSDIYFIMDSGPAMMCYHGKVPGLDRILIPACHSDHNDDSPDFRVADALIPLASLLPDNKER